MSLLSYIIFFLCFWISLEWCQKFTNTEANQIISVSHSMDNFYLAVAVMNADVRIYSLLTLKLLKIYTYTGFNPQKVRFSQDGRYLGIAYNNNNVQILNAVEPFGLNLTLAVNHNSLTNDIDFDSTGNLFLSCGNDNKIKLWTVVHGGTWSALRSNTVTPAGQTHTSCRFSPTNTYISHSTMSNLYTYTTSNFATAGSKASRRNTQAAWSRDESMIYASTTSDNKVYQYQRLPSFSESTLINGDQFNTIDVSPDGNYFITGGAGKVLYIYNQTLLNHLMIYQMAFPDVINDAKFSKDSKIFTLGLKNFQFYVYTSDCITYCQSGTIFNKTTSNCDKCSQIIQNCSICYNSTYCYQCQVGFYQNTETKLCSLCNIMEGCSICSVYNQCTSCAPGYTLNSSNLCEKCSKFMIGCNECNTTTICDSCVNEYYLDSGSNLCKLCQLSTKSTMTNCLRCTDDSTCIQCMPGFYANNSGKCTKCGNNCLYCENSANNCSQCTLGYYVNPPILYTCTACSYGCIACNATVCFDCVAQMYEASDGTCKFCPFPCTSCENTTYCEKCIDHYFLNQSDHKCYRCENNCNTCNSSTYCVSCMEGYFLQTSDNTCQLCSIMKPYCTQCNSTQCISCVKGFYYSSTATQCVKCISVMYQCVTCISATVCRQCAIGYYLTVSTGNSSCATCPLSCQECNSSTICTKCYPGFYLQLSNNTCMSCEDDYCTQCITKNQCTFCQLGYYLQAATKTCQICTTKGCYACIEISATQQCELCLPGYYLDTTSMTCKECNASCTACLISSTQCTSCAIGYFLDSVAQSCNTCPLSCSQCNSTNYCTSCSYGYYLDTSTNKCIHCTSKFNKSCLNCNATNCLICKAGFYLTNTTLNTPPQICKGCNETDLFCLQCSPTACSKCNDGAYLDASITPNKCKTCSSAIQGCISCLSSNACTRCQNGYFLDNTSNKCKVCQIGCEQCTSSTVCLRCNFHYYLQPSNTSCVLCQSQINGCSQCPTNTLCQSCLNGFYLQTINSTNSACNYCSQSIAGCQYCNSSTICTKCLGQYYLDSTLVPGSYLCSKCATAMPGCELCLNSTSCLKCESGFYLDSTSKLCSLCQVKLQGCIYCSSDGSACTFCNTGYFLSSTTKKCALCSTVQTGCQMCNQTSLGQFTCLQAKSGFYLQNMGTINQSSICNASYCEVCLQTDPSKCITCESAFYLNSSTQICIACQSNIQACLACASSTLCTSCQSGYFLDSNNQCSKCTSKFDNCLLCSQSQCLECKSLYILDSSTSGCQTCFQKFPGCKYCNETSCFYCSSNFYKSGNGCQPCDTINGCLACDNLGVCLKCKQNYFQDNTTKACNLCNSVMQGCFGCESSVVCVLCQSGYTLNDNKTCTKLTSTNSSSDIKSNLLKLVSEYINSNLLKHSLYSTQYDFSKIDLNKNLSQIELFMKYTSNSLAVKESLTILSYEWSSSNSQLLYLFTNNPLNVTSSKMAMFRRLLQSTSSSIALEDTTVIVSISQSLAQQMLPKALLVSDTQIQYDLNDAAFYASYLKQTSMTMWQFIVVGYIVITFLIINYTIRSFWTDKSVNSDHGEMILHYLSFAAPALIIYPTTVQLLSFCYGFMLLNFPWANDSLGRLLGNTFDNSPEVMKIFYANLNVGSTYLIALGVILILVIGGYFIISICYNQRNERSKQQNKSIFFNLIYNLFSYGALFTATLAVQGCFMNPINELLNFQNIANSLFYILGILMLFLIFVDLFHSLCIDPTKYFYKLRNILKTILLSLSHLNPTYFFSVLVIMDFLFVAGEYFISKKQNSKAFTFSWIIKNIALNVGLILLVFFSNKLISVLVCIGLILLSIALEIYQHCKLGEEKRKIAKLRIDHDDYQRAAGRTIHTELNDEGRQRNNANIWNIDISPEVNLAELTHTPINDRPQNPSSRKNTGRNDQNMTSIDTIFQSTDYEPRKRRDRKREPIKNTFSVTSNGFKGLTKVPSEKVMHVKKRDRYDVFDENIERISDF